MQASQLDTRAEGKGRCIVARSVRRVPYASYESHPARHHATLEPSHQNRLPARGPLALECRQQAIGAFGIDVIHGEPHARAPRQVRAVAEVTAEVLHARAERHDVEQRDGHAGDRKSTRLNSSHMSISYAVFCLKK